jgi:uncharacterized membrane protein YdjX (TVP38/TMEM64 family)
MHYRRLVILLIFVLLLVGMSALEPVQVAIKHFLDWSEPIVRHHDVLGMILFSFLSMVSAILFFFSSAIIIPVAVYAWGNSITILLLWASWLVGGGISYVIGRSPGRRLAKWVGSPKRFAAYDKKISAKASFKLVLLFQLAVPSEIPGFVLGALRYHFGKFIGARALADIPFAVGTVFLSDSFFRQNYIPLTVIGVGGVLLSALAVYLFHKRI